MHILCFNALISFVSVQDSHDRSDNIIDVDPEIVRKGVRNLMMQVAQIERERVRINLLNQFIVLLIKLYYYQGLSAEGTRGGAAPASQF